MCKITVVIPNYNGIRFLKDCLDAVLAQAPDTPEYEVMVVDNGSADGSLALLRESYPQVRVEALPENTGFCHAVNVGLRSSAAPYVILLNNDTKVKSDFIKNLCYAIEERPKAFAVSAKMLMWDDPELLDDAGDRYCVFGWAYARGKGKPAERYSAACEVFSACAGAAIYRKSIFEEIGYFDEEHFAYMEDLDMGYRARIYGYRSYYEPEAEVIHYGSASSGSRYNAWKTSLASANNIYVVGKNMPLLQWLWNLPFLVLGFLAKLVFFCGKGMGAEYIKGFRKGFARFFTSAGRAHRVKFQIRHLKNYFVIQGQLYLNVFRFLKKS
ncbi:MAG: glycosyltransferase family 2 protein [Firmicutes bacterium]|nr:glycosyltransferase family 2 protein [Bacillota bacterium]